MQHRSYKILGFIHYSRGRDFNVPCSCLPKTRVNPSRNGTITNYGAIIDKTEASNKASFKAFSLLRISSKSKCFIYPACSIDIHIINKFIIPCKYHYHAFGYVNYKVIKQLGYRIDYETAKTQTIMSYAINPVATLWVSVL